MVAQSTTPIPVVSTRAQGQKLDPAALKHAITTAVPDGSVLHGLMMLMAEQVELLQQDATSTVLQKDPQIRSQVSGRIITACKEIGALYQKQEEITRERHGEPEMVMQACLQIFVDKMKMTMAEVKMENELAQLFIQTLVANIADFETAVKKKTDEVRRAIKSAV